MNFFYVIKTKDGVELLTAKLDGTILPGVTRQSVMDVASEEFGLKVTERTLPMKEFIKYHQENKVSNNDSLLLFYTTILYHY